MAAPPAQPDAKIWGKFVSQFPEEYADIILSGAEEIWFGRDQCCHSDARFSDGTISKKHCKVYQDDDGRVSIYDNSANGTYVDGVLVGKEKTQQLTDGCVVSLIAPLPTEKKTKNFPGYRFVSIATAVTDLPDEEIAELRKRLETLEKKVERWSKGVEFYRESGTHLCQAGQQFLSLFEGEADGDETTERVVSVLQRLEQMKSELHQRTENILSVPMTGFLDNDIKVALEMEKNLRGLKKKYDELQGKMKKESDVKQKQLEPKFLEAKQAYDFQKMSYVSKLKEIEAKKTNNINNWLIKYMFANLDFLSSGHQYLQLLESEMQGKIQKMTREVQEQEEKHKTQIDKLKQINTVGNKKLKIRLEKQGYLLRNRRHVWFSILNGVLTYYKSWKDTAPLGTLDMFLCTVKTTPDLKKRLSFELVTPKTQYVLTAHSAEDLEDWLTVFKNSIAHQLHASKFVSADTLVTELAPINQVVQAHSSNGSCADCGAANPDWCVVNLGCVICHECSGVHRALGTHISKVRSLTLDKWEPQLLQIVKLMGNAKLNTVLEAHLRSKYPKPTSDSQRSVREKYINAKYKSRKFVLPKGAKGAGSAELSRQLYQTLISADDDTFVENILRYLALGADINWSNPDENCTTALHFAVAAGNLLAVELLIQNGASLSAADDKGWTPLHYATVNNQPGTARLLLNRGAVTDIKDHQGRTSLDLSKLYDYQDLTLILSP